MANEELHLPFLHPLKSGYSGYTVTTRMFIGRKSWLTEVTA